MGKIKKELYLTFDMDWAIDEVLLDFYDLIKELSVVGTIHVTHETKFLSLFREEKKLDCGIHPNYNFLLGGGQSESKSVDDILGKIKNIVPEAKCVRSHGLTSGNIIASKYSNYGIKYDLNTYIPAQRGMKIFPYKSPEGKVMVLPFIFEDDVYLAEPDCKAVDFFLGDEFEAPRIFNFHPIHLYLNTDKMETYENARPFFKDIKRLELMKNTENYGIRNFFIDLIEMANKDNWNLKKISDGDWR